MRGAESNPRPTEQRPEGISLPDGADAFYEVPWPVIERCRVSDPHAAAFTEGGAADLRRFAGQRWTVEGGIYARLAEEQ